MNNFIEFLSNKNITNEEVFLICSAAKKSVIRVALLHDKNILYMVETIQDIFENNLHGVLQTFTSRLIEKEAMLLHQSKHATMGKMLEYITHQWKEPLSLATFSISKIEYKYNTKTLNEKIFTKEVEHIKTSLKHMNQTIVDFKNFFDSKREKSNFNVGESICNIYSLIDPLFKTNNITLVKKCTNDTVVNTYKNDFDQAILNILSNAKDVLIERKIKDPKVYINIINLDKKVQIKICDNAGGIDQSLLTKIFSPYFTTKDNGSGIGLFMSKTIINKCLEGEIKVSNITSNIGYGACFEIILYL